MLSNVTLYRLEGPDLQDDSEAKTGEAGNFAHMGFYKRAQNSVRVADLLELLKANLRYLFLVLCPVD